VTTILNREPAAATPRTERRRASSGRAAGDRAVRPDVVAIVGMGYVGLPTALGMLDSGTPVIGVDISADRLSAIERFDVDLLEQDLDRLRRHLHTDTFVLSGDPTVIREASTVIVCVPTPISDHFNPDLGALSAACRDVVANARRGQTIVLTSTTYIGCTRDMIIRPLTERGLAVGRDIHVAYAPERVDPGVAGHVIEDTPRVVGGATEGCTAAAIAALASACPSMRAVSSPEAAELTKLLENSFRAVNIALANEVSDVAGHFGLSPIEIVDAAATKPYGFMPFYPGPGVGGHCIPCDPHYLLWQLRAERMTSPVIDAAMTDIAQRPKRVVTRIREMLADAGISIHEARVHVVGVAYKPGVADLRESPALEVLHELSDAGAAISYSDRHIPEISIDGRQLTSRVPAARDVDLVLIHTHHPGADLRWVNEHALVLDATYRLEEVAHRELV
jgi:nucleotide sugar dehydrogenase